MNNRWAGSLLVFVLLAFLAVPACGSKDRTTAEQNTAKRIVILFDNPLAENYFALTCLKGAEKAKSEYGISLSMSEAGSDAEAALILSQLAESRRYDLIITIGASQIAALKQTAAKYSKQKFSAVDGDIADMPNVSSLLTRDNESSFLAGALAALMTKTNRIGFVGGREQASIKRFLAGYQAGAQSISPDCKVLAAYAGSWLNDGKSKSLALQQIAGGADIVYGPAGAGSLGVIEAARENGVFAIGVDADQSPVAPQTVLISAVKHVDVCVYETIRSLMEGRFKGGIQSAGLKEGAVEGKINTDIQLITPSLQAKITELEKKIISGEIMAADK